LYVQIDLLKFPAVAALALVGSVAPAQQPALETLNLAVDAMGGRAHLAAIHSLKLDLRAISYRIDDSERADGPFWVNVATGTEWRDEDGKRFRRDMEDASAQWSLRKVQIGNATALATGAWWLGKMRWSVQPSIGDHFALSPERLLLTAAAASDLHAAPDAMLFGKPQDVLGFTWKGFSVLLYLDKAMHLPVRLEVTRASPFDRLSEMLGDVTWRTDYLFYKPQLGGLVYPFQWNVFRDGQPALTTVVVGLEENAPLPDGGFEPPPEARLDQGGANTPYADAPIAIPADGDPLQDLAPHVWLIAGNWNVMVVQQPDGLVVVECPQSGGYSEKIMALLAQRFPGIPIKAVVSTTDSLWHYAGVRAYVARGIPIYALGLNVPRLRSFVQRPRTIVPDTLARHPRPAILRGVSDRLVIGEGETRIALYPIRGHGDERMMMAFLPDSGLLYGSSNDIGIGIDEPTFNAFEVVARAEQLHLPVRSYVAIHTPKMPWMRFKAIVRNKPVLSGHSWRPPSFSKARE
jgi:hypothetical protein